MFDTSHIKRLLVLISTAAGGIAAVVAGTLMLGNPFPDTPAVAADAPVPPAVQEVAKAVAALPPAAVALESRFNGGIRPLINQCMHVSRC